MLFNSHMTRALHTFEGKTKSTFDLQVIAKIMAKLIIINE